MTHINEPLRLIWSREALAVPPAAEVEALYHARLGPAFVQDVAHTHTVFRTSMSAGLGPHLAAAFGYRLSGFRGALGQMALADISTLTTDIAAIATIVHDDISTPPSDETNIYLAFEKPRRRYAASALPVNDAGYTAARRQTATINTSAGVLDLAESLQKNTMPDRYKDEVAAGGTGADYLATHWARRRQSGDIYALGRRLFIIEAEALKRTRTSEPLDRADYDALANLYNLRLQAARPRPW